MTAAQRDAIISPAQGLIIFCSDCALGEGELQVRLTSSWKNTIGGDVNDPRPPAIGDFYGGGVVFHLFVEGEIGYVAGETHGLIAAVADQSSGIRWYNGTYVTTGATGTAVGTGSCQYRCNYKCTRRNRNILCSRTGKGIYWRRIYRLVFTLKR